MIKEICLVAGIAEMRGVLDWHWLRIHYLFEFIISIFQILLTFESWIGSIVQISPLIDVPCNWTYGQQLKKLTLKISKAHYTISSAMSLLYCTISIRGSMVLHWISTRLCLDVYNKTVMKMRRVIIRHSSYYSRLLLGTLEFRLDGTKVNGENNT